MRCISLIPSHAAPPSLTRARQTASLLGPHSPRLDLRANATGWRHRGQLGCSPLSTERVRIPWNPSSRTQCMPAWEHGKDALAAARPPCWDWWEFDSLIEERTWVQTPKRGDGTFLETDEGDRARLLPKSKGRKKRSLPTTVPKEVNRQQGRESPTPSRPNGLRPKRPWHRAPDERQWCFAMPGWGERGGGTRPNTRQDDNRAWPDQGAHLPTSPRVC